MRTFISCLMARVAALALKIKGSGATTLPGRIALKIKPDLLSKLSKNVKVIIVTGTNGKTTTCRMLEQAYIDKKKSYFLNKSGANLITGITTAFINNSNIFGKNKKEYAIIECDENAFKKVSLYVNPEVVMVTNIFRDQLDRYGEITHTLNAIKESISHLPKATLVLDADCSMTYSIAKDFPNNKVLTYGVNKPFTENVQENYPSDAKYCIFCKEEYNYDYITFGHLGGFKCPKCGYSRVEPDVSVENTLEIDADYSVVEMNILGNTYKSKINVAGVYNIYNAAGAALVLKCMNFEDQDIINSLENFNCAFGRMETFKNGEQKIHLILVKNPAGFSLVTSHLSNISKDFSACFCLNDNAADGRDVSWIWDVRFNGLLSSPHLKKIYTCGKRAYDMALLIKYNGYDDEKISVIEDENYEQMIEIIKNEDRDFFIVPTYTSMMKQRHLIAAQFGGKEFWE